MKSLIIHPKDHSTDFLKPIYTTIPNKTLITDGITKTELRKLIEIHDRIIMLGHGSPEGLLSVDQFPCNSPYIIDLTMVDLLSPKTGNIYIWCNADQFVRQHQLSGFFCGMFISEIQEAWHNNFHDLDENAITQSNDEFAKIVSRYINEPMDVLFKNVIHKYGLLAKTNRIAKFNLDRLYLTKQNMFSCKVNELQY